MERTQNDVDVVEAINEKTPYEFSSPWLYSDVVLVVEDTKFHVHKYIMSRWSLVFRTMFSSQFIESSAKEIPLPGKRECDFQQLLNLIYNDEPKGQVTETNYECLLKLAREYQMDTVLEYCRQYMGQGIDEKNALRRYKVAEHFELQEVMEKCNEEAGLLSSTDLEKSPDFLELGIESKFKICMTRVQELEKPLRKFAESCSTLTRFYFKEVEDKISYHFHCPSRAYHQTDINGDLKDFDLSCPYCKECAIEETTKPVDRTALNEYLIQLDDLKQEEKIAKIIEQMIASEG